MHGEGTGRGTFMAINEGKESVVLQYVAESGMKSWWFSAVLESQSMWTSTC